MEQLFTIMNDINLTLNLNQSFFSFLIKKFRSFSVLFSLINGESDSAESVSDMELLERFSRGEKDCFDILVKRYSDMIFSLCCSMMNDYDEGSDCAQETFIRAYRKIHTFQGRSSLSTWLYTIGVNTCRNRLTSSYRKRRVFFEDGDSSGLRDTGRGPGEQLEKNYIEEQIRKAVSMLPEQERVIVVLRDFENRTYEEITIITGVKTGTVKSRLARARHRLRDHLRGLEI